MISIFKKAPQIKESNITYRNIMLLSIEISSSFLFATTIVGIMSDFTFSDESAAHIIFKGIFAVSMIIVGIMYFISKKIYCLVYACIVGFITVMFPLFSSISDYRYVKSIADKFSMSQDYTSFLLSIGIYLLYTILCFLTGLYVTGYFKYSIIVTLVSVITSLATLFMAIDRAINYDTSIFDIITFGSTCITSLIPIIAVSSAKDINNKTKHSERTEK